MIYDPCKKATVVGLSNSNPSAVDGITALMYKVIVDYLPNCAGVISGQNSICQNSNAITFSIDTIRNATSYIWELPTGFTGTSNTKSLTITPTKDPVSGWVKVKGNNAYGEGAESTFYITVNNTYNIIENKQICEGSGYTWNNLSYNKTGTYNAKLTTINGCDSNVTLNLTINPKYLFIDTAFVCSGETYNWKGQDYTTEVSNSSKTYTYFKNYVSVAGCDSIYQLNLIANPKFNFNENFTICDGESLEWRGKEYKIAGDYTADYLTYLGCDSNYTMNLKVMPKYSFEENMTICKGESFNWQNKTYTTTGKYFENYKTLSGCDSNYTLNLEVKSYKPLVSSVSDKLQTNLVAETYQWVDCDNNYQAIVGEINNIFQPKKSGKYAIITIKEGCKDTSDCIDFVYNSIEKSNSNNFTISPNPATESIFISNYVGYVEIYNSIGEIVLSRSFISDEQIRVNNLANGVYFVKSNIGISKLIIIR